MKIIEKIARALAPGLKTEAEIKALVTEEVARAKMSLPITANYDPNNEGYRPLIGQSGQRRDLRHVDIDRMMEVAYWMFDHSAMVRGLSLMDKAFLFSEPVTVSSDDEDVQALLTRFWEENELDEKFPDWCLWLSLLGAQCWTAQVNKYNGAVTLGYVDPQNIKELYVLPVDVQTVVQVELKGSPGRPGQKLAVARKDLNFRSKDYGKFVGECFFHSINHPPNDPWGRSDFLTLFDWIDGLERYGYNYLERAEFMLNFIWDVMLKGMTEDQIREWLKSNKAPDPGSLRAHNENVEWNAVSPDLKATDFTAGFDMGKGFIMGAARRPASWFGEGGKAYQTEADQFGQVPIKDLDDRQRKCKKMAEKLCKFALDQALVAGVLREEKAAAGFTVNMAEISKKDFSRLGAIVPQFATALSIAETNGWLRNQDAVKLFAIVMGQLGMEVDTEAVLEERKKKEESKVTKDYE